MRQWGHSAAAGIIALEEGPQQLKKDHENCELIAKALDGQNWVKSMDYSTNICRFKLDDGLSDKFINYMKNKGIKVQMAGNLFRIATHNGVSQISAQKVIQAINEFGQ